MRKVLYEKAKIIDNYSDNNRLLGTNLRDIDNELPVGYTSLRYPAGNDAHTFNWNESKDKLDKLISTINTHPTCHKLVYVLNMSMDNDSLIENIKYLCKGGVGRQSIAPGKVYIELGNEPYAYLETLENVEEYIDKCNELIPLIKEIGKFAGILLPYETSFTVADWLGKENILSWWNDAVRSSSYPVVGYTHLSCHLYSTHGDAAYTGGDMFRYVAEFNNLIEYEETPICVTEVSAYFTDHAPSDTEKDAFWFTAIAALSSNRKIELMQHWNVDEPHFMLGEDGNRFLGATYATVISGDPGEPDVCIPAYQNNVVMDFQVPYGYQSSSGNVPFRLFSPDAVVGYYCGRIIITNTSYMEIEVEVEEGKTAVVFKQNGDVEEVLYSPLQLEWGDVLFIEDNVLG